MIKHDFNLKSLNTFGLDIKADKYFSFTNIDELRRFMQNSKIDLNEILILGGGSNILFSKNYPGLVLHPNIDFIKKIEENNDEIFLEVGSGVNWDTFVKYCVKNRYYGAENMSLIPGNVGATAVQNAGAYGTEAKDLIMYVKVFDLYENKEMILNNIDCKFEYRNSIFKTDSYKNRILITSIVYKLSKISKYRAKINSYKGNRFKKQYFFWRDFIYHLSRSVNIKSIGKKSVLDYRFLKNLLEDSGLLSLELKRRIVIKTRTSKLPDIKKLGNVGSFFKNPIITLEKSQKLKQDYPNVILFPYVEGYMKVSAAWLIDQCGLSGERIGDAATLKHLPLTIVNYGEATSNDILNLADKIEKRVLSKFDVVLEKEVVIV